MMAEITPHTNSASGYPSGLASAQKPSQIRRVRKKPTTNATNTAAIINRTFAYDLDTGLISVFFLADTYTDYIITEKEARVSKFIAYPANQALALPID